MDLIVRNYDLDKKDYFILAAENWLQKLYLINNKCNEIKNKYPEYCDSKLDFLYNINSPFNYITELIENAKDCITDVYTYAAMDNNKAYIKLKEFNTKLEMINLELKPLTGICKSNCDIYYNNFINYITPDTELYNSIISKRMEYYSMGLNWRFILLKDPSNISQEEYMFLAAKYLDMSTIEMNIFFESQLRHVKGADNEHLCPYWYIDKEMSFYINEYIKIYLENDLSKMSEIENRNSLEYEEQKRLGSLHMQKAVLLSSIYSVDKYYDFGAIPKIYKENEEYIFKYYNNLYGDNTDGVNSGRKYREIIVSECLYKDESKDEVDKLRKEITQERFNKSLSEVAWEEFSIGIFDVLSGKSDEGIEKLLDNKVSIPIISKVCDSHKKYLENKEILNIYMNIDNLDDFVNYYDWFALNVVNCNMYEYDINGNATLLNAETFVRQSPVTYEVIGRFNESDLAVNMNSGKEITLYDVMNDSDNIRKILENIKSDELTRGRFHIIKTGG